MGPTVHTYTHTHSSSSLLVRTARVTCACAGVRVTGPLLTTPLRALTLSPPSIPLSHPPPLNTLARYIPHAALKTDDHPRSLHTRVSTCLPASYSLSLRAHTHTYTRAHTYTHAFLLLFTTLRQPPPRLYATHSRSLYYCANRTYPSISLLL
jgi:hypothetical protein